MSLRLQTSGSEFQMVSLVPCDQKDLLIFITGKFLWRLRTPLHPVLTFLYKIVPSPLCGKESPHSQSRVSTSWRGLSLVYFLNCRGCPWSVLVNVSPDRTESYFSDHLLTYDSLTHRITPLPDRPKVFSGPYSGGTTETKSNTNWWLIDGFNSARRVGGRTVLLTGCDGASDDPSSTINCLLSNSFLSRRLVRPLTLTVSGSRTLSLVTLLCRVHNTQDLHVSFYFKVFNEPWFSLETITFGRD